MSSKSDESWIMLTDSDDEIPLPVLKIEDSYDIGLILCESIPKDIFFDFYNFNNKLSPAL